MNRRAILIAMLSLLTCGVSAQSEEEGGRMLPKDSLRLDGYIPSSDSPLMEHDSLLLLKLIQPTSGFKDATKLDITPVSTTTDVATGK